MNLISVYGAEDAEKTLYALLAERSPDHNISHKKMPSWKKHFNFVNSKPYTCWYFIVDGGKRRVGSIYLTHNREVGLFLFPEFQGQGHGSWALTELRDRYPGPILANISPMNDASKRFFEKRGFKHIQETYELV